MTHGSSCPSPLDAIESAQWGEPDPKFRDPDIAAYVKWLREDMPGRVTQLAALTTVQRFDAKGTRAAFDLVPRPERELAQYENFELDRAEMRHIREMRIEQHLARSALELRLEPTAELRRVLRDMFLPQDKAQRAVQAAVQRGLLVFTPPTEMRQGHGDRVEVGIARSPDLKEVLLDGLRGRGQPLFEEIRTSSVMRVELKGEAFDVTAHSAPEQVVAPSTRWEFDVVPRRAGPHTLTLCVCLFVAVAGLTETGEGLISEPVLERSVRVRVSVGYNTRRFVTANWQWLIATAVGLAGGISAWIALVH